jgi:hypothetical protein
MNNHLFNIFVGVFVIVCLPEGTNWFLELFIVISVMMAADKIHFLIIERHIFTEWANKHIVRKED